MPRKHIGGRRKLQGFHVFNQGAKVDGRPRRVFVDKEDKRYFLWLVARHLSPTPKRDARGRPFLHLRLKLTLIAFNVMTTHFHLIVWQHSEGAVAALMNRVKSSYTRYFNEKYGNTQPLFNGRVQSKEIDSPKYFKWLVGYVHDNHPDGFEYEFSSHRAWIDEDECPDWLDPAPGLRVFGGVDDYKTYLNDRASRKRLDSKLGFTRKQAGNLP